MIDTVRVAELNNELGVVQETIQRATQRAEELVAELRTALLIEEPIEQPEGKGLTPPASQPAPVAGTGRETTSSSGDASRPTQPAASSYTPVTCAGCGREFRSRQSLGPHKKGCKGHVDPFGDAAVSTNVRTNGRVTYLCSRNCGATFETRAESDAHEKAATCAPKATRPSTEEERRLRLAGSIGGLGE